MGIEYFVPEGTVSLLNLWSYERAYKKYVEDNLKKFTFIFEESMEEKEE